jgi:hypothetical protein
VTQNDKNAMNLIDPFQFRALFQGARSVAVVGNAPCILNYQNGADIDSHDLVVRFNRARTAGMEQTIGSRTDILFVNASNSLAKAPPPDQLCKPRCLVCFVSPQGLKAIDVAPFREWAGNCPVLMSYGPDLIGLPGLPRSKPLTSGTYALFTLLRLFDIERLFVTGFTMFGAVAGGGGKYWNEPVPAAATAHDLDQEGKRRCLAISRGSCMPPTKCVPWRNSTAWTCRVRKLVQRTGQEFHFAGAWLMDWHGVSSESA